MEKKYKKKVRKNLDPELVAYMIDVMAGPRLMMISVRYLHRAEKAQGILKMAINDMYSKNRIQFNDDPGGFINATQHLVDELLGHFIHHNLKDAFINGMERRPTIVQPGGFNPKVVH